VRDELAQAASDIKRRQHAHKAKGQEIRRDRDEAIRKAAAGGLPLADIGDVFDLSESRVSRIVRRRR